MPVEQSFHSLAYIHAAHKPGARIGLHSPLRGESYFVPVHKCGNIWVYGMDILLTGWLTHEEFRRRASVLNAGMRTFQYARTRTKNLLVPMAELNPLTLLSLEPALPQEIDPGASQILTITFSKPADNTAVFKILDFSVDIYFYYSQPRRVGKIFRNQLNNQRPASHGAGLLLICSLRSGER